MKLPPTSSIKGTSQHRSMMRMILDFMEMSFLDFRNIVQIQQIFKSAALLQSLGLIRHLTEDTQQRLGAGEACTDPAIVAEVDLAAVHIAHMVHSLIKFRQLVLLHDFVVDFLLSGGGHAEGMLLHVAGAVLCMDVIQNLGDLLACDCQHFHQQHGGVDAVLAVDAREEFLRLMEMYGIETISAYNLNFDMRALRNTTEKLFGKGKRFLTKEYKEVDLLCIWSLACEVLYSRPSYLRFIDKYNLMTEKGNPLTSAEVGYRYLQDNNEFEESHTGLQDVRIECKILAKCIAQKKKHDSGILPSPWRIVSNYKKDREQQKEV